MIYVSAGGKVHKSEDEKALNAFAQVTEFLFFFFFNKKGIHKLFSTSEWTVC